MPEGYSPRILTSSIKAVTIGAADAVIAGFSSNRRRIEFHGTSGIFSWLLNGVVSAALQGIAVRADRPPIVFDRETHGELPSHEWHAFGGGAGEVIIVVEVFG